jgi:glycosyltransferase involved in cell wall biosynthesis
MFTTFYPPWNFGGDGIQVERLAHALADRGHSVTVVCSPRAYRLFSRESPQAPPDRAGIEVVPLAGGPIALTGRYLSGRPVGARRQLQQVLARDFDVLHFHNPSLLGAPTLLGMGDGVKLYTAHEQWLLCPSHVLWRRSGRVCEDPPCWSCEIAHGRPPQPWRHTSSLRRSIRHLDALITPSNTSAALHRRFADLVTVEPIPHFTPAAEPTGSAPADNGPAAPDRPYFLFVGRLEPIKGVETLIEAFRNRPSEDLVIAGDGNLSRRLRRRAAGLDNVRFTGWLSLEQLDPLYRDALAVVVPTLGHEGMPLVPLESLARGTPIVAHRFGVLGELADATGGAITYSSPLDLDAALDRIASNESLRRRLGERGRLATSELFSVEAHLRRYLSLIERLARGRGDHELAGAARAAAAVGRTQRVPSPG